MENAAFTPKDQWPNKTRIHKKVPVPFGYKINPENELELLPDYEKIPLIEQGLDFVDDGSSYREVADWLSVELNDTVSHQTVSNWWKQKRSKLPGNERAKAQRAKKRETAPKTPREKAEHEARLKLAAAKRSVTNRARKLKGYQEDWDEDSEIDGVFIPSNYGDEDELTTTLEQDVIFKPNEGPQSTFLAASEREVLYGGAAGGLG